MQTMTETQTDANQYRVISSLHWIRSVCLLGVGGRGQGLRGASEEAGEGSRGRDRQTETERQRRRSQ